MAEICVWEPQPGPQTALVTCPVFEVLYGGARGGGKTDGVLGEWLSHAYDHGENAIGLMVRRTLKQLGETIERSKVLFTPLGAKFHEQDKMWKMPNGARLRMNYLERDEDAQHYQGHSYTRVYVEEITNFPSPAPIMKLMATLRSGAGVPTGFRATGNPGGPGHVWVKARYIDPAPDGMKIVKSTFKNPWTGEEIEKERVFIPSKLRDNAYLGTDYIANLAMSGSEALVKAWLEGDWSVIEGAFFDCWSAARHVVRPFQIPQDWLRFRSMDWGSAHPFSVGWWAVVQDDYWIPREAGVGELRLPRGCLVRYKEWYGAKGPKEGLKLTSAEQAQGIIEREPDKDIAYGVLSPDAWQVRGGPSVAEEINRILGASGREGFRQADNKRTAKLGPISGWDQMRKRLVGVDPDSPMMVVFSTCKDFIRTVPALQHDPDHPEDVMKEADDDVGDEARYACMSRPWVPRKQEEPIDPRPYYEGVPGSNTIQMKVDLREYLDRKAKAQRKARRY